MPNAPPPDGGPGVGQADYVGRVNRVIDHVVTHIDEPHTLEDLAAIANFSPFHFHRVFRSLLGETLHQFTKRLRLERAVALLSQPRPGSLTEIALACGFGSSSDFSRSFKARYGVSPSAFDVAGFRSSRREEWQRAIAEDSLRHLLRGLEPGENPDGFEVELRELPPRTVAYLRVLDPYRPDAVTGAAERLVAWAEARGCADGQWLGYMWDDPDVVAHADCRYDVGVEVDAGVRARRGDAATDEAVGFFEFPAMTVAQVEVRGGIDLEMRALDWIYKTWLPSSRCLPVDQPCFEAWIGRPFAHGFEHFELFVQLPVRVAGVQ